MAGGAQGAAGAALPSPPQIALRPATEVTAAERRRIDDLEREALVGEPVDDYEWIADYAWYILVEVDGELVSTLGMVERLATVGGLPIRLGGIGNVATLPDWRGRGLARAALARAVEFLAGERGAEFCLLFCEPHRISFYSQLGWQLIEAPLTFQQSSGPLVYPGHAMVLSCTGRPWLQRPVDLGGLPW